MKMQKFSPQKKSVCVGEFWKNKIKQGLGGMGGEPFLCDETVRDFCEFFLGVELRSFFFQKSVPLWQQPSKEFLE